MGTRLVLALALLGTSPVPAAAYGQSPATATAPRIAGPSPVDPRLVPGDSAGRQPKPSDSLPCPQCNPPRRFWPALASLLVVQAIPASVNMFVRDAEWAQVSLQTIQNNLTYPWEWDDNAFVNNQFSHPYQGNLYYNSARTNGYDFWASSLWAAGGSLMWECCFEAWAPSPNDFVNTTLGGIILGEALYRASRLPLDNTATGAGRTWREIGSLVLNPVSGVTRALRGEWGEVSANPPGWRPRVVLGLLDIGYRSITQSVAGSPDEQGETQLNASFLLSYGDPVRDLRRQPFSYFAIRADLAGPKSGNVLNQLSARGNLASWPLDPASRNQVALFVEYDFFDNPAFTYGGTGAQAGLVTSFGAPGSTWWGQTQLLFNGVLLGAVASDYYAAVEGRNYDYGPGIGTILSGRVTYRDRWQVVAGYTGLSIWTVDGTPSSHYQDASVIELRYWTGSRIGFGGSYTAYSRHSSYDGFPEVDHFASFLRLFMSSAFPRLP